MIIETSHQLFDQSMPATVAVVVVAAVFALILLRLDLVQQLIELVREGLEPRGIKDGESGIR